MHNLSTAIKLHQQKKFDEAERLYIMLLYEKPDDINCQYLLGSLYHEVQHYSKAEKYLAIAFSSARDNSDIAFAYAKNLLSLTKIQEARNALSRHLHNRKCFRIYIRCVDVELLMPRQEKKEFNTWQAKEVGKYAFSLKNFEFAIKCFEQAMEDIQSESECLYLTAICKDKLGDYYTALKYYDYLVENMPEKFDVIFNRGVLSYNLGKKLSAKDDFLTAISLNPSDSRAYLYLSTVLFELGNKDIYLQPLVKYLAHNPSDASIYGRLCESMISEGKETEAHDIITTAPSHMQHHPEIIKLKSRLQWVSDRTQAINLLRNYPDNPELVIELIKRYIQDGQINEANQMLPKIQGVERFQIEVEALKHAIRYCGSTENDGIEDDYRLLVQEFIFTTDDISIESLEALRLYLVDRHNDASEPQSQSFEGGTQISHVLYDNSNPISEKFLSFVRSSVNTYLSNLAGRKPRYLGSVNSERADVKIHEGWSVNLKSGGEHKYHIHPEGALSAVFYVDTPSEVNGESSQGHLAFGVPEFVADLESKPEYLVTPEEGKLVIFPSHLWHGTLPFCSQQSRLTVAFDIVLS